MRLFGLTVLFAMTAAAVTVRVLYQKGRLTFWHGHRKPKRGDIRIACAGDSITYGYGVSRWPKKHYPAVLQELLGTGFCVQNFGVCGCTASEKGDRPYQQEPLYQKSLAFQPHIVILMLGTNDTKPQNWRGVKQYQEELKKRILEYRTLPTHPELFLMASPPAWNVDGSGVRYGIDAGVLGKELYQAGRALAEEMGIGYIDLYRTMQDPCLFWDGVHPNADGAGHIAKIVYQSMQQERQTV